MTPNQEINLIHYALIRQCTSLNNFQHIEIQRIKIKFRF